MFLRARDVLLVTHDQTEAMALADEMAVMSAGKVLEIGQPENLYCKPGNRVVAEFLGRTNWLTATVNEWGCAKTEIGLIKCPLPDVLSRGSAIQSRHSARVGGVESRPSRRSEFFCWKNRSPGVSWRRSPLLGRRRERPVCW